MRSRRTKDHIVLHLSPREMAMLGRIFASHGKIFSWWFPEHDGEAWNGWNRRALNGLLRGIPEAVLLIDRPHKKRT